MCIEAAVEEVTSTAEESPEPKQIHSFFFVRYHIYDDPKIKAKLDEAGKEIEKCNLARIQITNDMKAKRVERSELFAQFDYMMLECNGLDSNTQKIDGVIRKLRTIKLEMESLEAELKSLMEKREKAFQKIKLLRKKRDEGNSKFFRSRELMDKARKMAANRNLKDLKDLSDAEVEKFMSLWNSNKKFRTTYERRAPASLVARQLSQNSGRRVRKPLAEPTTSAPPGTDVVVMEENINHTETEVIRMEGHEGMVSDALLIESPGKDDEEIDEAKLKEMRRAEEAEKERQAMDRKRKLQERAAAKAAIKAQIEAQKKLKKTKKKTAVIVSSSSDTEAPDAPLVEKDKTEASDPVKEKTKKKPVVPRERCFRYKNRGRLTESRSKFTKRKQPAGFLVSVIAAAAVVVMMIIQIALWNLKLKTRV